ncbi:helix-turn-helix domain-containing protein [Nocardiopsis potens]|uniref:helix-turn-helix domain-containing protein n=1 Tax=Nocardiopsis potens TaxID=1246458 RepID=UPI00034DD484|nr:MerR family transcriptional regulator [Nocardiopsis potens]
MSDQHGVSIGQAAALYGVAPSTLRWWESQRVLPEPPRAGGRRVYTEAELRRVGLAYLCRVTGAMPLEQASVVTSGSRNAHWQRTVKRHAEVLEEKIRELRSAREYLMHLLECPGDDIVEECPWLDGELRDRTPRGRLPEQGLVDAAQSAPRHGPLPGGRDGTGDPCDGTSAAPSRCIVCADAFSQPPTGRRRRYCSRACRQRHYRKNARPQPA